MTVGELIGYLRKANPDLTVNVRVHWNEESLVGIELSEGLVTLHDGEHV